jgi:hypothetical protein
LFDFWIWFLVRLIKILIDKILIEIPNPSLNHNRNPNLNPKFKA